MELKNYDMENVMLYKDVEGGVVKDVDSTKGIVTGLFSKFDNVDSDKDVVRKGAYKKSIKENGPDSITPRIFHLKGHDINLTLAKPNVLKEVTEGLYFESKISQTSFGKDTLLLYEDGVLTEHSIGYQIVKSTNDEKTGIQELIELKLWEGSTVTWGANMEARVRSVGKSLNKIDEKEANILIDKFNILEKAMRTGKYTDDTFRLLEIQLLQIKQLIISLMSDTEPVASTHVDTEPKNEVTADWIIKKLNINI